MIAYVATLLCAVSASLRVRMESRRSHHEAVVESMWKDEGRTDAETPISLVFALTMGTSIEKMESMLFDIADPTSSNYGSHLSLDNVAALTASSEEHVALVHEFLDLHLVPEEARSLSRTKDALTVTVPVKTAESLLHVTFHKYRHQSTGTTLHRSNTGSYSLPMHISAAVDIVSGVVGLPREMPTFTHDEVERTATATPEFLRSHYKVPADSVGGKSRRNNIAVVEFLDQYYSEKDLALFADLFSLPYRPVSRVIGPNNASNPGGEASLDIQILVGVAPEVPTWFMSYPGLRNNSAKADMTNQEPFMRWLLDLSNYDDETAPLVYSVSYADDEDDLDIRFMTRINRELIKQGLRGFTILVAAGDDGCGGYTVRTTNECKKTTPMFPASSPYVTSIGGTQISLPDLEEYVSSTEDDAARISTGGGFSQYFARPSYQDFHVENYLQQEDKQPWKLRFNPSGRAYPDISGLSNSYPTYINGKVINVAGTSASTPLIASIVSLMNDERLANNGKPMGFLNPWLYHIARTSPSTVTDVTDGNNRCSALSSNCCPAGFEAAPGWDAVTGLGVPNVENMFRFI